MRLDLDLIKNILGSIEQSDEMITNTDIMKAVNIDYNSDDKDFNLFYHHLKMAYEIGAIDCVNSKLGITIGLGGHASIASVRIELTFKGHQLLDSLRNETLKNKILATGKTLGIESLKQIPSLAISLLSN